MSGVIVKIMVEVLTILAIATKEVKRGRFSEFDVVVYILPFSLTGYSEKYFKQLTGNREIEDSLERLGKLTQEAQMASAEQLEMAQNIDDIMVSIQGEEVKYIDTEVKDISSKDQGVDDRLGRDIRSLSLTLIPMTLTSFAGNRLRDSIFRWLSPPDQSTNHIIARKFRHNGTARWFFEGSIFKEWKSESTGSLWIHGKRASLWPPSLRDER